MRILRYLKGTRTHGLCFSADEENRLIGWSDSDHAGDLQTMRSTSGSLIRFGSGVLVWISRRQQGVTLSTMEAELFALVETLKSSLWLSRLLSELVSEITTVM